MLRPKSDRQVATARSSTRSSIFASGPLSKQKFGFEWQDPVIIATGQSSCSRHLDAKALVDDFAHDLFLVMDFQSEIFRELCIHLASRPFLDTSELFWGFVRR